MKVQLTLLMLMFLVFRSAESGPNCPLPSTLECVCSDRPDRGGHTVVVCHGIRSISHLQEVTVSLKSMLIDRLLLINAFTDYNISQDVYATNNMLDPADRKIISPVDGLFPKKWLLELKVRDFEVQNGNMNNYFLHDEAFEGQGDYLISLVARNVGLKGHLCGSCSSSNNSVSTKGLRRTPLLEFVDFSDNQLEMLDGVVFPNTLKNLARLVLSNNKITKVNDNAFSSLNLKHIDLSRNKLTTFNRKILKQNDSTLATLDLSYNLIQSLPEDIFLGLTGLKNVDVSHNLLETLHQTTWQKLPQTIENVNTRGNFLVCDCNMNWLARRMSKTSKLFGYCSLPKSAEYRDLSHLPEIIGSC